MRILNTLPERGTYSRVGACPYLLDPIYEPRPCKGLISRILLRGKPRPRYAPLTGAAARIDKLRREIGASPYPKYEPLSGAIPVPELRSNSMLRRPRPTSIAAQPRPRVAKIRLIRTCWCQRPFQGQRPAPERPSNSLLRRPRPTLNCGAAPQPRCNNSINSNLPAPAPLPEPYFGQCGASAPEGGTYSRVGACPYLLVPI